MRGPVLILAVSLLTYGCPQAIGVQQPSSSRRTSDAGPRADASLADAATGDGGTIDASVGPACPGLAAKTAGLKQADVSDGSLTSAIAVGNNRVGMVFEDVARRTVSFGILNADGSTHAMPRVVSNNAISPDIAFADGDFAIIFHDLSLNDLVFMRFDRSGNQVVSVPLAQTINDSAGYPKIANRLDRFLVAYFDGTDQTSFVVKSARVGFDGIRIERFMPLSSSAGTTALVDLTTTNTGYAATWIDESTGTPRIFAARIGADGLKQTPPGDIQITNGARPNLFPTIASDGQALEICFDVSIGGISKEIECAHVAADNQVQPTVTVATGDQVASLPKTLWTGTHYIVAWAAENPGIGEVFGRVLLPNGQPERPTIRLTEISGTSAYPAIGWLGNSLAVGWFQFASATGWDYVYSTFGCGQ